MQERQSVKNEADGITHALFDLDRSVSSAAYFLPPFQVRSLSATVTGLRSELQSARERRLPHAPFAFSNADAIVLVDDPMQQVRAHRRPAAMSAHCRTHVTCCMMRRH